MSYPIPTKKLLEEYKNKKSIICARLKSFDKISSASEKELFEELAFCLFTPGSKALNASRAITELKRKRLFFNGSKQSVSETLKGVVRFHNNKASYFIGARAQFQKRSRFNLRNFIDADNPFKARQWLVKNIKGLGYKEASHFLRNIGLGQGLAILDTHILKNLCKFKVIKEIPSALTEKSYLAVESHMRDFSRRINIPLDALDLLFWSEETGFIYK